MFLTVAVGSLGSMLWADDPAPPWWDDFPVLVQTTDAAQATRVHASAALCGAANDPAWGLFAQRLGIASMQPVVKGLRAAGVHPMSWFEGFGTTQTYVAQLKREPDGSWLRDADGVTRVFSTHWSWTQYDGSGEVRWLGTPDYFDDAEFARPFTRTHPRYGAPAATYPDGRAATGHTAPGDDPRTHRFYDATCAKDILGRVTLDLEYNVDINRVSHESGQVAGPVGGLLKGDAPAGSPQPGFTKKEWAQLKPQRFASSFHAAKDSACPLWADYARASVRQALDAGMDGLWVDNWSAWDSWNAEPLLFAFGDWSEAGFREHLRKFPAEMLRSWGVDDPAQCNIREALQARCKALGGDPANLYDSHWRDPRWREDPLWRAYIIYKRQAGTAALSRYYRTLKEEAAKAGRPDFLVAGNDIPIFSLGWARGDVDMASTEVSYGWGLLSGPRGLMPPPLGGYVPIYNLGREHTRSRFMNVWMYVRPEEKARANLARVLYYQALANHASPMPHYEGSAVTAGNEAVDAEFFAFVRSVAPVFGKREPLREIGIYYSSSSQLMEFVPAGVRDHARQPHAFAFLGWGTGLTQLHVPWRAVPEWKLNSETLGGLRALIIPSADVFPAEDVAALTAWIRGGGTLIIAGDSGSRLGESGNFDPAPAGSTLAPLEGKEHVVKLEKDPGLEFYAASDQRPTFLPALAKVLAGACPEPLLIAAPDVSWKVGLTPYRVGARLFVDINNTDLDAATDTLTATARLHFTLSIPADLRGAKWKARVLAPDEPPAVDVKVDADRLDISLGSVSTFASVMLDKE
jgi:hypothetical protein